MHCLHQLDAKGEGMQFRPHSRAKKLRERVISKEGETPKAEAQRGIVTKGFQVEIILNLVFIGLAMHVKYLL